MATDKTPKISKASAIQLIEGQIEQFSLLLSSRATEADFKERFLFLFRETVSIIYQSISKDNALSFVEIVVSNFEFFDDIESINTNPTYNKIMDIFIDVYYREKIDHIFKASCRKAGSQNRSLTSAGILLLNIGIAASIATAAVKDALFGTSSHDYLEHSESNRLIAKIPTTRIVENCIDQLNIYKMRVMETWKDDQLYPTIIENLYRVGDIIGSRVSDLVQGKCDTVGSVKED